MDAHMVDKCTSIFLAYDQDKNGYIDTKELKNILQDIAMEFGKSPPDDERVKAVFSVVDSDDNGKITKDELFSFLVSVWGITAPNPSK